MRCGSVKLAHYCRLRTKRGWLFTLPVKMSKSKICHAPGTQYYDRTKNFTPYNSMDDCLAVGGRLPK